MQPTCMRRKGGELINLRNKFKKKFRDGEPFSDAYCVLLLLPLLVASPSHMYCMKFWSILSQKKRNPSAMHAGDIHGLAIQYDARALLA